jgi:hypothetical protein
MRLLIAFAVLLILVSSCQRELDIDVQQRPTGDSIAHVTPMFRVVEIDPNFPADSSVRIIKRVELNGVKSVIITEVTTWAPTDTVFSLFSYDAQGHLSNIKYGPEADMADYQVRYQFTWNGNRLIRVVGDTLGSFAESFDLSYTPNGANSVVTSVQIPSYDLITPDAIITRKHNVTVNSQFLPVSDRYVDYFYSSSGNADPNLPQMSHDTSTGFFNYSGSDLSSVDYYFSRHDTNVSIIPYTNIVLDTAAYSYTRVGGSNLSDSLIKIFGPEVYTLMNFDLLYFYYGYWIATSADDQCFFYRRPLSTLNVSHRAWENGVFDPLTSFSNVLYNKMDNTFDAAGRLAKAVVYQDQSPSAISFIFKFYYD